LRIVITGGAGMLGRDVERAAREVNHEPVALTRADLDICDGEAVEQAFIEHYPGAVINCAAWTNVDGAEEHEAEATEVNGRGAGNVAAAAAAVGASVVHPSTDYVFDGSKEDGYVESDDVAPISGYGRSKLAGEREVAAANPRHWIVRSSWLFGIHGRNFVETMLGLAQDRDEVVVVRDQVGCPTYTGHLAAGLVRLLDGEDFGLHHMAGGGRCSWYDFAVEIFKQAGLECHVLSMTSDMLDRPAPRPAFSVLESEREHPVLLPDWHDGLADYLAERAQAGARA
jgi:dTDP-4-dehydrorhamnose reductase